MPEVEKYGKAANMKKRMVTMRILFNVLSVNFGV